MNLLRQLLPSPMPMRERYLCAVLALITLPIWLPVLVVIALWLAGESAGRSLAQRLLGPYCPPGATYNGESDFGHHGILLDYTDEMSGSNFAVLKGASRDEIEEAHRACRHRFQIARNRSEQ